MSKEQKGFKIPYGDSYFEGMRKNDYLYVDKTAFIKQLERVKRVIHLRPRRFGKSLFISMLEAYYDVVNAHQFDELFEGLYIHEHPTVSQNNYYVLRFDFSGIATQDFETIMDGFLNKVKNSVDTFISKYNLKIKVKDYMTPASILNSLFEAFERLNPGRKICILIDEYDHFTNAVLNNGLDDFMTLVKRGGQVRSFYEVIKEKCGRGTIDRFFMTGVMSVSLDSMTSGFNIATNITTVGEFSDMMGFTSEEVKAILGTALENTRDEVVQLNELEKKELYQIFRDNYNGYLFSEESETKVFNSTLILYYLQSYIREKRHPRNLVDPNLNQSAVTVNGLVEVRNKETNYEVIEEIVKNKSISGRLSDFVDLSKGYSRNDFITVLFHMGFLTIKETGLLAKFEMPNKVIEGVYFAYMAELARIRYAYKLDVGKQDMAIVRMGEDGEIDEITTLVSEFLQHLSLRDAINFDEKYIKIVYLQFLYPTDQFVVFSEFPARQGYTDLTILKSPSSYATYEILIELKHVKKGKKDETTAKRVEEAFEKGRGQIAEYMTDKRLANRPCLKKFVVVFAGFEVVKMEEIV